MKEMGLSENWCGTIEGGIRLCCSFTCIPARPLQRRAEIKASEISKNRCGQILEPGFRVIFPETDIKPAPGGLVLTDTCEVKETSIR